MADSIETLLKQLGAMNYTAPSSFKGYKSGYKQAKYTPVNLPSYKLKPSDFKSLGKSKSKQSGFKPNVWDLLTGTLGQLGGLVTDSAYHTLDDVKHIKDKNKPLWKKLEELLLEDSIVGSVGRGIKHGAKEQLKDWKDGHFSWGDVPGIGALHGADKGYKRGENIMGLAGVDNRWGKIGGGIAIDIAADPLTYLTGGLSMATKLGKVAEVAKIAELGKSIGLGGKFKNADEFLSSATDFYKAKYANYPHLSEHIADKAVAKKIGDLAEQIKTARNTTHNANINKWGVSVPFSNKLTAPLGDIKEGSLLHRTEATLGTEYQHLVENLLKHTGEVTGADSTKLEQLHNMVKSRYGVNSFDQLTKTQYDDLVTKLEPFLKTKIKGLPDSKVTENMVEKSMPNEIFNIKTKKGKPMETVTYNHEYLTVDDIMKNIHEFNPRIAKQIEPMIRGLDDVNEIKRLAPEAIQMFGDFSKKIMKTAKGKTLEEIKKAFSTAADIVRKLPKTNHTGNITKDPDIVWKELERVVEHFKNGNPEKLKPLKDKEFYKNLADANKNPFNEISNTKTKFEHFLDKKNPFDARTLKTGNKFVDSMADHIADANSQKLGETAMYTKGLQKVDEFIKKNKITEQEMKEAIYHLENKAPDSLGKDWVPSEKSKQLADIIRPLVDQIGNDDIAAGVLSKMTKNYFPHVINKSDNDLKKLLEFDQRHPELKGLNKNNKFDKSRKSFKTIADRDNYMAKLSKLIAKETDPEAKKALQGQLERVENMFDTDVVSALTRRVREGVRARAMKEMQTKLSKFGMMKSNPTDIVEQTKGMIKLEPSEAKKLGLGDGEHYMHPEVLDGLKRVDEIFTNQGMNKYARHLAAISDIWRPLVTYYKPSHYINNLIGNAITNMAAGVKISDYKVANKLMNGYRKGKLTKAQMEIMKSAYKHNVISGGFLFDSKGTFHFDEPTKLEKIAKTVGDNKQIKKVRYVGELGDDITRLANYVNGLNKFGDASQAAKQVRTYLFNYNELTNVDRSMRVAIPFWNWTKRNVPLQLKLLMENPKFAMNNIRFRELFNKDEKGEDWQKESGIKVSKNRYTTVPSPVNDLTLANNPAQFLGGLNPAIKMLLETSVNKKFYTGKPISYGSDGVQAKDVPGYLASNLGIGGNMYDLANGKDSLPEFLLKLFKSTSKIDPKK